MECHFNEAIVPSLDSVLNVEYSCLKSPIYSVVNMTGSRMSCNTHKLYFELYQWPNRIYFAFLFPLLPWIIVHLAQVEV